MDFCNEYVNSPHGIQNYHRPKHQLLKKELLIGPVTALALPSFVQNCDADNDTFASTQAFLVARGSYVDLDFDDSIGKKSYTYSAFRNDDGGTVHGMKQCVGAVNVEKATMDLWLFYGGRRFCWVLIDKNAGMMPASDIEYNPFTNLPILDREGNLNDSYQANDWIWDARSIRVENPKSAHADVSDESFRILAALGFANNSVEILSFVSTRKEGKIAVVPTILRKIICDTRCITYSLNFFGWKPDPSNSLFRSSNPVNLDLAVVVGTVSNEVLVWNALDKNEEFLLKYDNPTSEITKKKVIHRLLGHEGVIHSVKVGFGGKYLVSTSDDRTVRLWGETRSIKEEKSHDFTQPFESHENVRNLTSVERNFKLLWTAFGHSARVWDSSFISANCDSFRNSQGGIVSVGEDSTIRIWNIDDGSELAMIRGHVCQSIWKVVSSPNTILTGGNDGTAKIWDVDHQLIMNATGIKPCLQVAEKDRPTMRIVKIPEDEDPGNRIQTPAPNNRIDEDAGVEQNPTENKKRKKKKKKEPVHRQIICGTALYTAGDAKRNLIVATRAGTLLSMDVATGIWTTYESWSKQVGSDEQLVDPTKGSCIGVRPNGSDVVIGTSKGELLMLGLDSINHSDKKMFSTPQYPAIQSVHWIDANNLMAFHIKGIAVWWNIESNTTNNSTKFPHVRFVFNMARDGLVVGIPMAYYHDPEKKHMFFGDSRGNLAVFDCSESDDLGGVRFALDVLSYTHKKEYVTGIVPSLDGKGVLSVGNDGFIHEADVRSTPKGPKLVSIIRRPVSCLTGISHIWRIQEDASSDKVVVAGYYGNKFIVWDQSVGYQLLSLDTGGRNRHLDVAIKFHGGLRSTSHDIAIVIANKNSQNEVLLHSHAPQYNRNIPSQYNLGEPCHGETILDATFCGTTSSGNPVLLSGSNDCTAKIFIVVKNKIKLIHELQPLESCVRAVCASQHSGSKTSLLVITGGKLLCAFYLLDETDDENYKVTFLCNNKLQESPVIDQRMNAVAAIPLSQKSNHRSHLVVSGDSDGSIHFATITEDIGQSPRLPTFILSQEQRPILSVKMKEIPNQNHILLCVGNTAGDIGIWLLPATNINPLNLPGAPLYKYCGNQVGTNCIAFTFITEDKKYPKVLIVNGGDDQAISCTTVCIDVESNKRNCLDVCNVITYTEACASAIKGIAIEGDAGSGFRVYTAGYDNRLSVWALNPSQRLKYLSSTPIDVKDINTLACYPFKSKDRKGDRKVLLVAGGEGMEILSFDRNLFDAALALKKCNYLLITCGAGFSEDSGLSTYENMPDQYRELCNALRLVDNPKEFQLFWHEFSQVYANTDPHGGYKILEQWCHGKTLGNLITNSVADCDTVYSSPWWIYSSNVDGHFSRSNCFSNTICEIHGCATRFRCSQSLGICDGEKRKGALWDSWNNVAAKSFISEQCATDTFPVDNAEDGNITCKRCKLPARPNVLLFHDTDPNMINSISQHRDRYQKWEERIENDVVHNGRRMVILELGAGLNVPAVRNETEEVLRDTLERLTASNSNGNITCIRVNPKDAGFSPQDESRQCISIYQRAEKALLMIDHILGVMS